MQSTPVATHQQQLLQQLHHTESMADEETPNNPGMGDDDEDREGDDDDEGGDEGDMGEGDEGDISMAEAGGANTGDGDEDHAMQGTDAGDDNSGSGANTNPTASSSQNGTSSKDATRASPGAERRNMEEAARGYLAEQTYSVVIPSYSTWFDMNTISEIEKKSLPEFFNNRNRSKTWVVYKDYRDFMINTYRLNPAEYLTVTACRRNLAGDVCAIMRVHAFLEQWGLINYQVDADSRPSNIGPPSTGHFRVTADTPRGLMPFQPGPNTIAATPGRPHPSTDKAIAASAAPIPKADLNLELRKNFYDAAGNKISTTEASGSTGESQTNGHVEGGEAGGSAAPPAASSSTTGGAVPPGEPKKQIRCHSCGIDCTRVRYHNAKSKKLELCPNCYLEGRFPSTSTSSDFIKMEDVSYQPLDRDRSWTDQETLLLLEGLELYDEDWNKIADHVGTRTREQCVIQFLQLPIEDQYLEEKPETLGPLQYNRVPFSQADNPVMSVVAFLATMVDPQVAAAAAQSSITEMTKSLEKKMKISGSKKSAKGKGPATQPTTATREKEKEGLDSITATAAEKEKETAGEKAEGEKEAAVKPEPSTSAVVEPTDTMEVDHESSLPPTPHTPLTSSPPHSPTLSHADTSPPGSPSHRATNPPDPSPLSKIASVTLGTAAARAFALATHEERAMSRLVSSAVNASLRKMELKLAQFQELEGVLQAERRELERGRQQLFLDRLAMKKVVNEVEARLRDAGAAGVGPGGMQGNRLVYQGLGVPEEGVSQVGVRPISEENPGGYTFQEA
ncbi:SWIRM domain-containing protein [Tirmania nivea]|nr:SWIRM domain-containing protein [Tirmania nivea]